MARTRSPDYDSIQDLILKRTADLFAQRGYVASSIGDIAEACACSKSRLYHYFDSKESILISMLTTHVDRLLVGAREIVAQYSDPTERLVQINRFFLEIYAVSRAEHVVLLTCMQFLPDANRREIVDKQRELVSYVRNILKALQPEDAGLSGTTELDTMLFFGMINWTYTWYRAEGPVQPHDLADRAVRLFLEGYRAVSAGPAPLSQPAAGIKALNGQ